ncbi:MAG: hypothetical protein AB8G99_24250 [Planctomycetaceae bacterium]
MRVSIFSAVIALTFVGSTALKASVVGNPSQQSASEPEIATADTKALSKTDQRIIRSRIDQILERDQQFRSYLSFGTTDDAEIERLNQLDTKAMLVEMASKKRQLSPEVQSLLQQLQLKNDKQNYADFYDIVREHGYPSPKRIGVKHDRLFVLLLHPPCPAEEIEDHIDHMSKLLLPEVQSGRMKGKMFATFVDNMRGKILRQPQLYGTNQQFDRKTGTILPPVIVDLDKTNIAREELGMPALKPGEYRLAESKTATQ